MKSYEVSFWWVFYTMIPFFSVPVAVLILVFVFQGGQQLTGDQGKVREFLSIWSKVRKIIISQVNFYLRDN